MTRRHSPRQRERGQALVELALVLPILLLVLMAIVDFGRVFHGHLAVTNAAREGARRAAVGASDSVVTAATVAAAAPLDSNIITVTISPAPSERYAGGSISVQVNYSLSILTPFMQAILPNPFPVVGRAVMIQE